MSDGTEGLVLISLYYLVLRHVLRLVVLRCRSHDFKELEIVVLQHELGTRRVHFAGCTPNPSGPWMTQPARQLTWTLAERQEPLRFLIRDRDQKFSESFDGIEIVRTPFRAPQANGVAERFVRTVRAECLDWLLILNGLHLEQVVRVFIDHYNGHRPHRSLALVPPAPMRLPAGEWSGACVLRRDRLGGAIHEYTLAA